MAIASVNKREDGYFLAFKIQNIMDNTVVYSKSLPCKHCDTYQVVEKLKELAGTTTQASVAIAPAAEEPKARINDAETDLWEQVQKSNTEDDYQAYMKGFPKGKLCQVLEIVCEIYVCGAEAVFEPIRRAKGGRRSLRPPRRKEYDFRGEELPLE